MKQLLRIYAILTLSLYTCITLSSFIPGTLVKTVNGHIPIEQLQVNDHVACWNGTEYIHAPVLHIGCTVKQHLVNLTINGTTITTTPYQLIYISEEKGWKEARTLKPGDRLASCHDTYLIVNDVSHIHTPTLIYSITVEHHHNFFITHDNVLVHNDGGITIALAFAFGEKCIEFISASAAISLFGWLLGCKWIKDRETKATAAQGCFTLDFRKNNGFPETFNEAYNEEAQAPGKPTAQDGYEPPKNWDGKKVKNPNGPGAGWPDKNGEVWVPTGPGPKAHRGPHWDVQNPKTKKHRNVLPGGKTC